MSENPVFIVDLVLRFSGLLFPILYSACIEKIVEKKRMAGDLSTMPEHGGVYLNVLLLAARSAGH